MVSLLPTELSPHLALSIPPLTSVLTLVGFHDTASSLVYSGSLDDLYLSVFAAVLDLLRPYVDTQAVTMSVLINLFFLC